MTTRQISEISVGELTQRLLRGRTIRPNFRLPVSEDEARVILTAAYASEVAARGGDMQEGAGDNIAAVARYLTEEGGKRFGIMLCGISGNGKTTMMQAIRTTIAVTNRAKLFSHQTRMTIVDAVELTRIPLRSDSEWQEMKRQEVLGIEDMGRESTGVSSYGNTFAPLIELLEYRYANRLYTLITTNLRADEIRAKYGTRIADRFNEMLGVVIFKNGTYRK